MKFRITFEYMDGESIPMDVHPDDMDALMKCIGKGEVYFNPERGVGVWVHVDKVRYFNVESIDDKGNRVIQPPAEVSEDDGEHRIEGISDEY